MLPVRYLKQPPVLGEVVAGIVLGPSLLGWLAPELSASLFAPSVMPYLSGLAQLGVILYMFLVGLELDTATLRAKGHVILGISHARIVAPFALGVTSCLWLYPLAATSDVSFRTFSMFMGVCMSITAFPVLRALRPGGQIVIPDLVAPVAKRAREYAAWAWNEAVRRASAEQPSAWQVFRDDGWNFFEAADDPDSVDKPSAIGEHLRWLEAAGFAEVDVYWMSAGHAIYGATRPSGG